MTDWHFDLPDADYYNTQITLSQQNRAAIDMFSPRVVTWPTTRYFLLFYFKHTQIFFNSASKFSYWKFPLKSLIKFHVCIHAHNFCILPLSGSRLLFWSVSMAELCQQKQRLCPTKSLSVATFSQGGESAGAVVRKEMLGKHSLLIPWQGLLHEKLKPWTLYAHTKPLVETSPSLLLKDHKHAPLLLTFTELAERVCVSLNRHVNPC